MRSLLSRHYHMIRVSHRHAVINILVKISINLFVSVVKVIPLDVFWLVKDFPVLAEAVAMMMVTVVVVVNVSDGVTEALSEAESHGSRSIPAK